MKRIKLEEMKTVLGKTFLKAVRDDDGNPIMEVRRDAEGKPLTEVVRDKEGNAVGIQTAYRARTEPMDKALCELLKMFFLSIPADKFTRQDAIFGTKLVGNIDKSLQNGHNVLEIDEDVHDWIKRKLMDDKIGVPIFGVNLHIIEQALDNFERLHEPAEKTSKE